MTGQKLRIIIDGTEIPAEVGQTILEAADAAGVYIPRLCYHPELIPGGHCPVVHREGERKAHQCLHNDRHGRNGHRKRQPGNERAAAPHP